MDSVTRFTRKAERYARYRWGYAPEAIQAIFDLTGLDSRAVVADIGSGTGLVTKEFVDRVAKIYAIEPNASMRRYAEQALARRPSFTSVDGRAEATTLSGNSVDLIIAGQAIHWFEPEAAFEEFQRILKPGGWLAALFLKAENKEMYEALKPFFTVEYGWDPQPSPLPRFGDSHVDFYLRAGSAIEQRFPQVWRESWEVFQGGILSDSHAPDDSHPAFPRFILKLRQVFDQLNRDGFIQIQGATRLVLGELREA